ncbi:MAG: DUF1254 domain-containing protein [Mycolicibacterium cosmeticum]|nr:DUF1254 domain-containing protein [Mycolicibacterium cosmeticum]
MISADLLRARAVQAVIWGMPAVNFELLRQAAADAGATDNQIIYWSRLPGWKNQTLTPNPDTLYFFPFFNTRDTGPVVLDIPPAGDGALTGSVDDGWQCSLEDVGPAGADGGRGGKYLILPPGYDRPVPDGYIVLAADTFTGFGAIRSNIDSSSDADVDKAAAYGRRIGCYPLSQAAGPPATVFVDALDTLFDNKIPYDIRFFELLHRFVQREPWLQRDRAMIDVLKTIGIVKGMPFQPDRPATALLAEAIGEARDWLEAQYPHAFEPPYFPGTHWAVPAGREVIAGMQSGFADADSYPVDARGVLYSFIYFSAKRLGAGQFYVMAIDDAMGVPLDGGRTYVLTVPADPPVTRYWSATVYDRSTHAHLPDAERVSIASTATDVQRNPDGATEIYFGPERPPGAPNWIPTRGGRGFEVLFRLYGPQQALFDRTWSLPDIAPAV